MSSPDTARTAGRGGLAVLGAKAFFILVGFLQQTVLPRLIGADGYGALSRVLAPANIINNVVISSSIQGVSRSVAQVPDDKAPEAFRRALRVHVAIAIPVALLFFFFAPLYARFQHAPHILRPLQVVSLVVLGYGLYAPLIGSLNGRRLFTRQAGLDVTYAVLRTSGLLGLGWFFARSDQGLLGACVGFACAALLILPIAARISGIGRAGDAGTPVRAYLAFVGPVALGQIAVQLLMQSDIMVLGHFASRLVVEQQGLAGEVARKAADEIVAWYRGCQLFAFLPYQLLISLTFILFPMLAKAKAEGDREAIAGFVRSGTRLALVFACILVGTVSALAPHLLRLVYPIEFSQRGGDALRLLALGQGGFAILYVETTVLTSLGRERVSALLTWLAVALIAGLSWLAGASSHGGVELLERTASATTIALALTAVAGALIVRKVAGAFAAPLTLVRVFVALAVTVLAGTRVPWLGKLFVIPEAGVVALIALILLVVTREIGREDLAMVRRVVSRKRA